MDSKIIAIELTKRDMSCLHNCANEIRNGYAADFLMAFTQTNISFWDQVFKKLNGYEGYPLKDTFDFSFSEWEKIYNSVNAVIYELGPNDLQTLTGYNLQEMASLNLKIFCKLYDRHLPNVGWDDCDEY